MREPSELAPKFEYGDVLLMEELDPEDPTPTLSRNMTFIAICTGTKKDPYQAFAVLDLSANCEDHIVRYLYPNMHVHRVISELPVKEKCTTILPWDDDPDSMDLRCIISGKENVEWMKANRVSLSAVLEMAVV